MVTRKKIRLPPNAYRERGRAFSITIGISPRRAIFTDIAYGLECITALAELSVETGMVVYAYCLMPDHVHLLLGTADGYDVSLFVGQWKSLCAAIRRQRGGSGSFWQRSFYDHAIRENEDLLTVATYILNNPVRAGLVGSFREYALCGSFEFEL